MKIYHIKNLQNSSKINFSSSDRELLEEIICDQFIEDAADEFNKLIADGADLHNLIPMTRYAWNYIYGYYKLYIDIEESELI